MLSIKLKWFYSKKEHKLLILTTRHKVYQEQAVSFSVDNQHTLGVLVSFAAVFWMSRNASPKKREALRDIQKTAAKENRPLIVSSAAVLRFSVSSDLCVSIS